MKPMNLFSSEIKNDERRKYTRLASKNILHCQKFQFTYTADNPLIEAAVLNIGAGGLLFEAKKKYSLGDILKIELSIPGWSKFKNEFYKPDETSEAKPLVVLAKVLRVEVVKPELFDIGVSFVGIDSDHQQALLRYIREKTS